MPKTKDQLIEEAYQNVHDDRERLRSALLRVEEAAQSDPLLLPTVAKTAVLVTECMIKANAQLVELIKVESKSQPDPSGDGPFTAAEADHMWDKIEDDEEPEEADPAQAEKKVLSGSERKN